MINLKLSPKWYFSFGFTQEQTEFDFYLFPTVVIHQCNICRGLFLHWCTATIQIRYTHDAR